MVEGLTVGPDGNVYAATFNPAGSPGNHNCSPSTRQGSLLKQVNIQGSSSAMLGLEVHPGDDERAVGYRLRGRPGPGG